MARLKTERPAAQHITTIAEIDEALWWTSHQRERNAHWYRWLDALLDERNRIRKAGGTPDTQEDT